MIIILNMSTTITFVAVYVLALVVPMKCYRVPQPVLRTWVRAKTPVLFMTVSNSDHLMDAHDTLFKAIQDRLNLKKTDFTEFHQVQSWTASPYEGRCDWFDEVKGSKLTGVSKYSFMKGSSGASSFSIDGWLGPSLLAPHMLLSFGCDPDTFEGCSLTLDFIARGPIPLGSDTNLLEKYYGTDAIQFYDSIMSRPDVRILPPSSSFSSRLLRSPLHLSVAGLGVDDVVAFSTAHVESWLLWLEEASPVDARQRGAINSRDDKLRQFQFRSLLAYYRELLSRSESDDMVRRLGAGSTGPIAEAYVGGGS